MLTLLNAHGRLAKKGRRISKFQFRVILRGGVKQEVASSLSIWRPDAEETTDLDNEMSVFTIANTQKEEISYVHGWTECDDEIELTTIKPTKTWKK